ncbi:GNAT family N-acetyltransferase [Propionibacterium sp.]|uniref:GNAT family N-acetyltransferase n=1 Tax=Propionibacterium sp. TaxID=1977903 RepID=UPI0039E810CE
MLPFSPSAPGIVLTPPDAHDIDTVAQACNDEEIARWTALPAPYTRLDAENFCQIMVPQGWQSGTMLTWAVRGTTEGRPLAMIALSQQSPDSWELGFWTSRQARRRGLMTAATRAVAEQAFDPHGPLAARRLEWRCTFDGQTPNWASWRVAWKLGFHKQGRLRAAALHRGTRQDVWVADLLPDDLHQPACPWDGPLDREDQAAFGTTAMPTDADSRREGDLPEGMVRTFHRIYGLPLVEDAPSLDRPHLDMRMSLIAEEFGELVGAVYGATSRDLLEEAFNAARDATDDSHDVVGAADALADLVYVIYGMALETGIDLPAVLAEVQRSNMSKLGADGKPIYRADGKVLKGPHYRGPDIAAVLARGAHI